MMNRVKKIIVSVSGGKDSTATLLLALERQRDINVVFADTGNEHEITYDYIEYLEKTLSIRIDRVKADFTKQIMAKRDFILEKWALSGVPEDRIRAALEILSPTGNPFLDLCVWKGRFPSPMVRFCTTELKTIPLTEYALSIVADGHSVESWQGIRKDESRARATYPERELLDENIEVYRPILDWKASDTFDFMKKKGIKPNPLYKMGQTRVGCMPCINSRKGDIRAIAIRFPEVIERIDRWERIVGIGSKRGSSTFFPAAGENETAYERGNIWKKVEWATGKTPSLFMDFYENSLLEESSSCSSSYGLCE